MTYAIIQPPLTVSSADDLAWDDTADVVVVGFGGAGVVAALQARECGASVIAIDRFEGGGATAVSGGVIYAGGTRYQRDSGHHDTADEMYKYLEAENNAVQPDTLRRYCEGSADDLEWLEQYGVPHNGNVFEEKTAFPPNDYFLYYSGNEKMPAFAAKAKPAPRGHRTAINGFGGHLHFARLRQAAATHTVKLIQHAPVKRLIVDCNGSVVGVEINALPPNLWRDHQRLYKRVYPWAPFIGNIIERAIAKVQWMEAASDNPKRIRARRGVILSTGGFNHNREMLTTHRPILKNVYTMLLRLGSMGDDGSGILLGESVGGTTALMERVSVARTLVPPNAYAYGVVLNKNGERFTNEAGYAFNVGGAIIEQPEGSAWLLLESKTFWIGVYKSFFTGGNFIFWGLPALLNIFFGSTRRANSIAALCKKIGIDPTGAMQTLQVFNAMAKAGKPDPFGKLQELVQPIERGPFWAVNLSLSNRFAPAQTMTVGRLTVDEQTGLVKRADGGVVKGLYAAGRAAVGLCSGGFISGLSIADTVFSGRRAGRCAAEATAEIVDSQRA
jgi:3-oxo-5alpha-steroid 4-dehydrogenase